LKEVSKECAWLHGVFSEHRVYALNTDSSDVYVLLIVVTESLGYIVQSRSQERISTSVSGIVRKTVILYRIHCFFNYQLLLLLLSPSIRTINEKKRGLELSNV